MHLRKISALEIHVLIHHFLLTVERQENYYVKLERERAQAQSSGSA
jgi:hypothetical protein